MYWNLSSYNWISQHPIVFCDRWLILTSEFKVMTIITGHNEVLAKVMFLLEFVILFTGGICLSACWDTTPPHPGIRPPLLHTPLWHTPSGTPPTWHTPLWHTPSPRSRPRHMVNERPVRILLEYILVSITCFTD